MIQYPFLKNNELLIVDYIPGSSGQLFMRLWIELDKRYNYTNEIIFDDMSINDHLASHEIRYDIQVPKRIINWFVDRLIPTEISDYLNFFEFLGTFLIARSEKWIKQSTSQKFYNDINYKLENKHVIYAMHTWHYNLPIQEIQDLGYNVKTVSIVPTTPEGLKYQYDRAIACYNFDINTLQQNIDTFNQKQHYSTFDLCTLLVKKDTDSILAYYKENLGEFFRPEKVQHAIEILSQYYNTIVDNL